MDEFYPLYFPFLPFYTKNMIPYGNVLVLSVIFGFLGFVLGMVVFDQKKRDFESEIDQGCTSSRHIFDWDETKDEIYCFCGNDVLRPRDQEGFITLKT